MTSIKKEFKDNVSKLLVDLRLNDLAFFNIKTVCERKFKIQKIFDTDEILGYCLSPKLKDNIQLKIVFKQKLLYLYILKNKEEIYLNQIEWLNYKKTISFIKPYYNENIYSDKEVEDLVKNYPNYNKKNILKLHKIYKLRNIVKNGWFFGNGLFTFKLYNFSNMTHFSIRYLYLYGSNYSHICYMSNKIREKYLGYDLYHEINHINYYNRDHLELIKKIKNTLKTKIPC